MDEFVCVTVRGNPGEAEAAFKSRLTAFWTHMLRNREANYEQVFAEATGFEAADGVVTRQYMVESDGVTPLVAELAAAKFTFDEPDAEDTYSKYEAAPPDWFPIDHG